jgi:hypothetical protein
MHFMAYSKSTFNVVDGDSAADAGRQGGLSRSFRKRRAAKKNGRLGGRAPSRTLAEMLLRRKLSIKERDRIHRGIIENQVMLMGEARRLLVFYGRHERANDDAALWFISKDWRQQAPDIPPEIRALIMKFRAGARGLFLVS